jgi:voltage-gated potassium channel
LTVETLNPEVYTCAELINREYSSHIQMGQVSDDLVSEEQNGFIVAQSALNPHVIVIAHEKHDL